MSLLPGTAPVLTCAEARTLETALFGGDEAREWEAMQRAGRAVADGILRDFEEIGGFPGNGRMLVLIGKGHNGGDALLAGAEILRRFPGAHAEVLAVFGERSLRPLAARAWRELNHAFRSRLSADATFPEDSHRADTSPVSYDLCVDGVFGFQFRPPADSRVADLIARVNALPIHLRAAVDLPSAGLFRADFTYATGSVKTPVLEAPEAGRVRYLDLGFFRGDEDGANRVLTQEILAPLAGLRAASSDKRSHGHVFIIGGSRGYPGAVLMSVLSALRSGAGLVTAFVPESLVPAFAARAPEAMWVGWPETPAGSLALEGEHLFHERIDRATALVLGPGLGRESETLALAASIVRSSPVPLVLDADALQPEIVRAGAAPRIVTPHAGEFARISAGGTLRSFATAAGATVVLKGPTTRIARAFLNPGENQPARHQPRESPALPSPENTPVYHSFFGGPVLARGGSGDLLAGLIGGLLAQTPADPLLAASRGVVWHGVAADRLARAMGPTPVSVTQLLDFLPTALRASCPASTAARNCAP